MTVKLAQYGISHDHAPGKARVMKESDQVDFCGVFEPSQAVREALGVNPAYEGVHWFSRKEEILDEFRAVLDIAREKGLMVQLGYMFRYNAGFQFIIDWAKAGKLGDLFSVRARISSGPSTATEWERWDSRGEREGGIMFILACHLTDAIVTLLGRPNRITPISRTEGHDEFPWYRDNTAAVFEYDKAMAILESSSLEVSSGASRRLEVYGTRGSAILEPLEPPALRLCLDEDRDGYVEGWQTVPVENRPRYVESLRAFVADVRGEKHRDRTLDHEFEVQETVLRAAGLIEDAVP